MDKLGKHYTFAEVSEILRVTRRSLYAWRKEGRLEAVKVGKNWLVSQAELDRILSEGTGPVPKVEEIRA